MGTKKKRRNPFDPNIFLKSFSLNLRTFFPCPANVFPLTCEAFPSTCERFSLNLRTFFNCFQTPSEVNLMRLSKSSHRGGTVDQRVGTSVTLIALPKVRVGQSNEQVLPKVRKS